MTQSAEEIGTSPAAEEKSESRDSAVHAEKIVEKSQETKEEIKNIAGDQLESSAPKSIPGDKLTRRPPKLNDLEALIEKSLLQPTLPAVTSEIPSDDSPPTRRSGTIQLEKK